MTETAEVVVSGALEMEMEITIDTLAPPVAENTAGFSRAAVHWLKSLWDVSWSEVQKGS